MKKVISDDGGKRGARADASRLNGMHVEAIATLDDVSLPKNVIFKAGLIALGELEASKRADIIARVIAESGR